MALLWSGLVWYCGRRTVSCSCLLLPLLISVCVGSCLLLGLFCLLHAAHACIYTLALCPALCICHPRMALAACLVAAEGTHRGKRCFQYLITNLEAHCAATKYEGLGGHREWPQKVHLMQTYRTCWDSSSDSGFLQLQQCLFPQRV